MNADCLREISFHILPGDFDNWICICKEIQESVCMKRELFDKKYATKWKMRHGKITEWYRTGQIYWETCWDHNRKHEKEVGWWSTGQKWWEQVWDDGKRYGVYLEWDEEGNNWFTQGWTHGELS